MSTASEILDAVGGPGNIQSLTHCATRLRFQLVDASKVNPATVEAINGVMGAVPQSGERFQVIIGGAVESVYNDFMNLPAMAAGPKPVAAEQPTDAEVKAAARESGIRGRFAWVDTFFEFLSDSFRPILGTLLGASLFITFMALMSSMGVIDNWADPRVTLSPSWQFMNLLWKSVFVFLPLMVAYNASKKLDVDPWLGFAIMALVMLPGFTALGTSDAAYTTTVAGSEITVIKVFGLPLTIFDYSSQVFPPLLMAAVLGPVNKAIKRLIPANLQMIFVPFLTMVIMLPLTAFLIGPIGVYVGAWVSGGLSAINTFSPLIFAILIPVAYPFMVPLGLHWPLNAVMLVNISQLGYDYIQGPMGAWNFACFGATAGVLFLSMRDKDAAMRQTATGALAAGLLGGISEPSLYGIHLRFKRIYPSMLVGCLVGGLIQGIGGGVTTHAFVFTSLLTIPTFNNNAAGEQSTASMLLYAVSVLAAFAVSMILVVIRDYRTADQKAAAAAGATVVAGAVEVEAPRRAASATVSSEDHTLASSWVEMLGGASNVTAAASIAATRLRVEVADSTKVDQAALKADGVAAVEVTPGVWHLIVGTRASVLGEAVEEILVG